MLPLKIEAISAFSDNYIWTVRSTLHPKQVYVVDPGDAQPVIQYLETHSLTLKGVLITHWHADHIGGLPTLLEHSPPSLTIHAPFSEHIPNHLVTQRVKEGDIIDVFGLDFKIMETPGHTLDHIVYFNADNHVLFCGDTLFAGGCGRIFEGTPEIMHASLQRLAKLSLKTQVYCAHEYTLNNLQFARTVEPTNKELQSRYNEVQKLRANGKITLPSSMEYELACNPFLRVNSKEVLSSVLQNDHTLSQQASIQDWQVLGSLREWKNNF